MRVNIFDLSSLIFMAMFTRTHECYAFIYMEYSRIVSVCICSLISLCICPSFCLFRAFRVCDSRIVLFVARNIHLMSLSVYLFLNVHAFIRYSVCLCVYVSCQLLLKFLCFLLEVQTLLMWRQGELNYITWTDTCTSYYVNPQMSFNNVWHIIIT